MSTKVHNFHPTILKANDIRGVVDKTLFNEDAYYVGRSFGTVLKRLGKKNVVVGYDGRHSSVALTNEVIKGLTECGIDVINIGLGPSPMVYFAVHHFDADAGLVVSASHNPSEYNGFKFLLSERPFYGDDIKQLGEIAANGDFEDGKGAVKKEDIRDIYVDRMLQDASKTSNLKVAWDAGNGSAGEIMAKLTSKLPGEHTLLFEEIDGDFPNHHPDPTIPKNLVDLKKTVLEKGYDLGIAFDGDGDRIGVIDSVGEILWGDQLMVIFAEEVLKNYPGSPIISEVKASQNLYDAIEKLGGEPVMYKTGHSFIKTKMKEINSPLAGEMSGHIFFGDKYYGFDDALYVAVRLIDILTNSDKSLREIRESMPKSFNTPEIRIDVEEGENFGIVEDLKNKLRAKGVEFNDVDGIRANTEDGWWLLRGSNTQPILVARCESNTQEGLERLKDVLDGYLKEVNIDFLKSL